MWSGISPQDVTSWSEKNWPSTHYKAYGLGWSTFDYLGSKVIGHGGGYDGFITNTTFVPEKGLGMVILTNKNTSLYYPLKFKTLDILLNNEQETDWSNNFLELIESREEWKKDNDKKKEEERAKDSKPSLPVEDYLGIYNCEMYGDAKVYSEGGQLMVHLLPTEIFVGHLNHWQYNTWQVELKGVPALPKGLVNFIIDANGKVVEMEIDIPNPDFDFTELEFLKTE
jgi:hypothetical protein